MKTILGVDIAKDKFDCCLLLGEQKFSGQFANDPRGFKQLLRWLAKNGAEPKSVFVCMEATGLYGEKLLHWLYDQALSVSKVNPARIKYYARSRLARNKTDPKPANGSRRFKVKIPLAGSYSISKTWRMFDEL